MPKRNKSRSDSNETKAHYNFNIKDVRDWYGEIVYSINSLPIPGIFDGGLLSMSIINILAEVSSTTSKKIKIGAIVTISVYMEDGEPTESIGHISKRGQNTTFVIRLPWNMANHLHRILMSNRDVEMSMGGTELYRGAGLIHSFHVTKDSDSF